MSVIIDRRKNARAKTLRNRSRFIDLHRKQIKDGVKDILKDANITDVGTKKQIKVKPLSKPSFRHQRGSGDEKYVLPGNEEYVKGDKRRKKPPGGDEKGYSGEGEDDFTFDLTEEEFMDFVFEYLELPDMVKKTMRDVKQYDMQRAGFKITGTPNQMDYKRSMINSIGRRLALKRPKQEDIDKIEEAIENCTDKNEIIRLEEVLKAMRKRKGSIPFIDPFDIKYRNFEKHPRPRTKAVMMCLMDVSFSMSKQDKMIAKSFFMLLRIFLKKKYDAVDIRFISHHETAKEVDEHEFFYSQESGGTCVSSAYEEANKIIKDDYNLNDWNVYVAQASDGDNAPSDYAHMTDELIKLLDVSQYFAYIQTVSSDNMNNLYYGYMPSDTGVWKHLEDMRTTEPKINMKQASNIQDVWTVFTELFKKGKNRDTLV